MFGGASGGNNKAKANRPQDIEKLRQIPPEQKVWVGGLSGSGITWTQLQAHFGQVGTPIHTVVFEEKKGSGCVCFNTPLEASQAMVLNGTTIGNTLIQVDSYTTADPTSWVKSSKPKSSKPASSGKWQGGGNWQGGGKWQGGGNGADHLVKQMILKAITGGAGGSNWKDKGKNYKPSDKDMLKKIDDSLKVWVGGLTKEVKWDQLQKHFKQAGTIKYVATYAKDGYGCVAFKTAAEVQNAVVMLNGTVLGNCTLEVDFFKRKAK